MRQAVPCLLTLLAFFLPACSSDEHSSPGSSGVGISHEEEAGLDVLSDYAANLIGTNNFPNLDPYQPSEADDDFRKRIRDACPRVMDAEVLFGERGYSIGPRPKEFIGGERTNWVNPRIVRKLDTSGVSGHYEVEFDYTTLDGEKGSVPATVISVDRTIEGHDARLILTRERTQQYVRQIQLWGPG